MNKFILVLSLLVATLIVSGGCGSLPSAALSSASATPTRTPRPTFTPRASATRTPSDTDTPTPTETIPATATSELQASATATPKPLVKATRPPAPPVATPQPPKPQFPVHPDFGAPFECPQDNIYEVMIYIKQDSGAPRPYAGGLWFGVFNSGGGVINDYAGKPLVRQTEEEASISYGTNCQQAYDRLHPVVPNGKIEVGDAVRAGTPKMVFRFIRSQTDYAPISADTLLDFTTAGRWWLYFGYSGS